jgi:hypothetical protein
MWNASGLKKNDQKRCFETVPYEWYECENCKYATPVTSVCTGGLNDVEFNSHFIENIFYFITQADEVTKHGFGGM